MHGCAFNFFSVKIPAVAAIMSSIYHWTNAMQCNASICIDGNYTQAGDCGGLCHTQHEPAPWLAIEVQDPVYSVTIYNREGVNGGRFKNAEVRVTDHLPSSGDSMYLGGKLLGSFTGPGTGGQVINITGVKPLMGRYVLIQMSNANEPLNLLEVDVFSKSPQGEHNNQIRYCLFNLEASLYPTPESQSQKFHK